MRFNSRTPRGVRRARQAAVREAKQFQFTHPAWGATQAAVREAKHQSSFNSRTPRGVRRLRKRIDELMWIEVSIHAPRVGCDTNLTLNIYFNI